MRAGELRHRITIQQKTVTRDGFGGEVETWSALATVWAKVETPTGNEYLDVARAGAAVTQQVTIRNRDDVMPLMRLNWNERVLEIMAVLPDNRNRELRLMCSEVV